MPRRLTPENRDLWQAELARLSAARREYAHQLLLGHYGPEQLGAIERITDTSPPPPNRSLPPRFSSSTSGPESSSHRPLGGF